MAAEEGKRGAQRKEAPRHVTAPARPQMGGPGPAHLIYIEAAVWRARAPGSCSLQGAAVARASGQGAVPCDSNWDAALPNASPVALCHSLNPPSHAALAVGFAFPTARQLQRAARQKGLFGKEKINPEPLPSHRSTAAPLPAPVGITLGFAQGE